MASAALVLIGSLAAILFSGTYTRRVHVLGSLVPTTGFLTISQGQWATVTKVYPKRGQLVRRGDPLVEISQESNAEATNFTRLNVVHELAIKKTKLEADVALQETSFEQQKRALEEKIAFLKAEIDQNKKEQNTALARYSSAKQTYNRYFSLKSTGIVSLLQLDQQNDIVLAAQAQVSATRRDSLQLQQTNAEIAANINQLTTLAALKQNQLTRDISDVDRSLIDADLQHATVLRAAADCVVADVLVHSGQIAKPDQNLMILIPNVATLVAQVWVPTWAISSVKKNGTAKIYYDAFADRKRDVASGVIESVADTALSATQIIAETGVSVDGPAYRTLIRLDAQQIANVPIAARLRAGMLLRADIPTEQHTVLAWVLGAN